MIERKSLHFTITGEFMTEHARNLFVEDTPKNAVEFLTKSLIGMKDDMAWDIVLGKLKVTGDSDEGCGVEEDNTVSDVVGIPLTVESVWSRLARQYFNALGDLQSLQRRIMILGNADEQNGALYRFCGFEIWDGYVISLEEDRKVYIHRKEKFDAIVRQLMFVGNHIGKSIADLPIVNFEVPEDINQIGSAMRRGYIEQFSLEYLLNADLVTIKLEDDQRKVKYAEAIGDPDSKKFSAVDSYIESQRNIDRELKHGIQPSSVTEPKSAGWISPKGVYYALNGDIAHNLHIQIADALLDAGIIEDKDFGETHIRGNACDILDKEGWVKIHNEWVIYSGYDSNIPITDEQIQALYQYGQHGKGFLDFGYAKHRVTACNIPDIEKPLWAIKYFKL